MAGVFEIHVDKENPVFGRARLKPHDPSSVPRGTRVHPTCSLHTYPNAMFLDALEQNLTWSGNKRKEALKKENNTIVAQFRFSAVVGKSCFSVANTEERVHTRGQNGDAFYLFCGCVKGRVAASF